MNTLEVHIENRAVKELYKIGAHALKFGRYGWPDRLVMLGLAYPGACIWLEFKNADGTLRPAQKIRKKELEALGQVVHYPRSWQEAVTHVAAARRAIDRARGRYQRDTDTP